MKLRLLTVVACGPFVIAGLLAFGRASEAKSIVCVTPVVKPCVKINLIDFDPAVGDVHARLRLLLPPSMISEDQAPTRDLVMVDAENVDESILELSSTKPFSTYDGFINARYQVSDPGSQFRYPFDEHVTHLHFFVTEKNAGRAKSNVAGNGSLEHQNLTPIAIEYDCSACTFDGFDATITEDSRTLTDVQLKILISRTTPIKVFSVFLAIAMWTMTVVVLVLAIRVARQGRSAPEITTMAFIGGLLFAFPAIRGAQPRVPPMGVLSDYLAFFWDEFILIVALVVVMIAWLRYPREAQ